ncbi:ABC transporter ATP-binding protein [Sinorhizobium garamanticum]|uniref:ABC transporter ATP-binding protein n=1 Tax=Sinorhizobium garamanticum TaxID=680247 RepID=A0ABY8D4L1_9HYPH|nr:ABC transporter ATP-binding protein [Sinorhizobium garamanticum]WEX85790.1 ABC transporter ATP-binding protein [Sinorhizobium garamanticum]
MRVLIGTQRVVDGLSFNVFPGERVCLLGASGSGKSLTAGAILGLLPASACAQGSIRVQGREVIDLPAARRPIDVRVGMVFQDSFSALNPLVSIGSQLQEPFRRLHDLSPRAALQAAIELLDAMALPDPGQIVRRSPAELSGGQRQRVCIALALACKTPLLVADEPTTALDVVTQAQVLRVLKESTGRTGTPALLFITHDLCAASELCERAIVIERGTLVESNRVDALIADPQHSFTRELVAAARDGIGLAPRATEPTLAAGA